MSSTSRCVGAATLSSVTRTSSSSAPCRLTPPYSHIPSARIGTSRTGRIGFSTSSPTETSAACAPATAHRVWHMSAASHSTCYAGPRTGTALRHGADNRVGRHIQRSCHLPSRMTCFKRLFRAGPSGSGLPSRASRPAIAALGRAARRRRKPLARAVPRRSGCPGFEASSTPHRTA